MDFSEALSQTPLFAHLDRTDMQALAAVASLGRYRAGEWIVHHQDVWPYLFLIKEGEVTAVKESLEGRSLILETFRAGEIFWGLAFFTEGVPQPAAFRAARESELVLWSRQGLLPLLLRNGRLAWELSCLMVQRIQRAAAIVEELAFQPVAGRLAGLLLDHYQGAVGDYMARDLTLDEMAARIGSTREMVCRLLYRFSESGAIQINRTEFMIVDPSALEAFARKEKG